MKLVQHTIDYSESSNTLLDPQIIFEGEAILESDLTPILETEVDIYLEGIGQMAHKNEFMNQLINALLEGNNINLNGKTYRIYT